VISFFQKPTKAKKKAETKANNEGINSILRIQRHKSEQKPAGCNTQKPALFGHCLGWVREYGVSFDVEELDAVVYVCFLLLLFATHLILRPSPFIKGGG